MRRTDIILTGLLIGVAIGLCLFISTPTYRTKHSTQQSYRTTVSTDNNEMASPRYRTPTPKFEQVIGPYQSSIPVLSYQTNDPEPSTYRTIIQYRTYIPRSTYRTNGSRTIFIR